MSFSETVAAGDLRASLEALRDLLASELEAGVACKKCGGVVASPTAPLAARLAEVLKSLDALAPAQKGSKADELAKRRTERLAAAQKRAGGGGKRGSGGG